MAPTLTPRARSIATHVISPWGFTTYQDLHPRGRIILVFVVLAICVSDIVIDLQDGSFAWSEVISGAAVALSMSLFAWLPAAATVSMLAICALNVAVGGRGDQSIYLAAVTGLVVYTCPFWLSAIYALAAGGILTAIWAVTDDLTEFAFPSLLLLGLLSALVGWSLRSAHTREQTLALRMADAERERAIEIAAERERIADELHDIIAHDVTLIAMHARVLERVHDAALQTQSIDAVRQSADQALADIRRVLRIVRDDAADPPDDDGPHLRVPDALTSVRERLSTLGAEVKTDIQPDWEASSSITTTIVHVLREGATNIAKHGARRPKVDITLKADATEVSVSISNTLQPAQTEPVVSSSGYGIDRLRERVLLLGGELSTGLRDDLWVMQARLPRR